MRVCLFGLLLLLSVQVTFAQDSLTVVIEQKRDSMATGTDSLSIVLSSDEEEISEEPFLNAPVDSSNVNTRSFEDEKLKTFKEDEDFQYKETPTIAESLWDRLLRSLSDLIDSLFKNAVTTNWGRVFVYLLGLVAIVIIVMLILKVDAFKILYSGGDKGKINFQALEENIHEMDFDSLIQESIMKQDYRRAVRLTFLYALKILSDKHYISWESGKTNHDYVVELTQPELKRGFNELNFYFEYAWYGNFNITPEMFNKVQSIFLSWRGSVR